MEAGFIVLLVLMMGLGVIVGILIGRSRANRQYLQDTRFTQGTLNIDCSDPEFEPGLFLGLAVPVKDVISRKYITLDVNAIPQDSHK